MSNRITPENRLLPTIWMLRMRDGWDTFQPSEMCTPEGHGRGNDRIVFIEDMDGRKIWERSLQ